MSYFQEQLLISKKLFWTITFFSLLTDQYSASYYKKLTSAKQGTCEALIERPVNAILMLFYGLMDDYPNLLVE